MTLPSKVYDIMKFIVKFVPLLVAFIGTTFKVLGIGEATINIILVILGAVATMVQGLLEICRGNYFKERIKIKVNGGEEIPVDEYDTEEGEMPADGKGDEDGDNQ